MYCTKKSQVSKLSPTTQLASRFTMQPVHADVCWGYAHAHCEHNCTVQQTFKFSYVYLAQIPASVSLDDQAINWIFFYFISPAFTVEPSDTVVAIGHSLVLDCQATDAGSVPIDISWEKDGAWLIDPSNKPWRYLANSSLFYQSIGAKDVGKFKCAATIRGTSNIKYSRIAKVQLACKYWWIHAFVPKCNMQINSWISLCAFLLYISLGELSC